MKSSIMKNDLLRLSDIDYKFIPKEIMNSIYKVFVNIIKVSIKSDFNINKRVTGDAITNVFDCIEINTKLLKTTILVNIKLDEFEKEFLFNKDDFKE